MNYPLLRELLENHEGFRRTAYQDSVGVWTIGIGHSLLEPMDEDVLRLQFNVDVDIAVEECNKLFPNWRDLPDSKQVVLADMMFNLGYNRLSKFKRMLAAVARLDYGEAAKQMRDSKWCGQVGSRCDRLCKIMKD